MEKTLDGVMTRKNFLQIVGTMAAAAFLLKFFSSEQVLKTVAKKGLATNTYGNGSYGGKA
jgi:transcriptional regulatory protein LevR